MYHDYYNIIHQNHDYELDTQVLEFYRNLFDAKNEHLLEIGCGTGQHTILLSSLFKWVTAIDHDAEMISRAHNYLAKMSHQNVSFICSTALALSLKKIRTADVSCAFFNVINYIHDYEDLVVFFSEIYHCLKSGGIYLFDCLDSQQNYQEVFHQNLEYENNGQVCQRSIYSQYCRNTQILKVEEDYQGLLGDKVSHYRNSYRLWDQNQIKLAAEAAGFVLLINLQKQKINKNYKKQNQLLFVLQKARKF